MGYFYELKIPLRDISSEVQIDSNTSKDTEKSLGYKIGITAMLILIWICNGMEGAMKGTTLPDQRDRLGVTLEQMGVISSVAGFVSLGGVLLNGVLFDALITKTFMIVGFYLSLCSILLVVQKFLLSYAAYFVLDIIYRFGIAACDCIGNIVVLRIWGEKAAAPLFTIHMGFYIGGAIGPFIARPFLSPEFDNRTESVTIEPPGRYPDGSQIHLAYLVPGFILLSSGISFMAVHFLTPPLESPSNVDEMKDHRSFKTFLALFHPKTCAQSSHPVTVFLLVTFFIFYFCYSASCLPIIDYLYTYATESDLSFSKQDAALIDGLYYFCGFAGRLVFAIVSIWVPIQLTFFFNLFVIMIDGIALGMWGKDDRLGFVICCWVQSFSFATLWPGCTLWTDQYILLTATAFFLAPLGNSTGRAIFAPLYASYYDKGNPGVTMYGVGFFGILIFLLMIVRQIAVLKEGSRFKGGIEKKEDVEVVKYQSHHGITNHGYNRNRNE